MKPLYLPDSYNYIAVFLTLACNLKCEYCINYYEKGKFKKGILNGQDWLEGLNRIEPKSDIPVTLQGGEPSLHPDFIFIIKNLRYDFNIDVLTNLQFNVEQFIKEVPASRLRRNAPYANIRVSYHPEQMNLDSLIAKTLKMQEAGFSIGIFTIRHPRYKNIILEVQKKCKDKNIDFRTKEFLGEYNGRLYGTYKYKESCDKKFKKSSLCKTTELIIGPTGDIYRCHHDLYENFSPIGHILDRNFQVSDIYRKCGYFGHCNPCDAKIKNNRFQKFGYTSVKIKNID